MVVSHERGSHKASCCTCIRDHACQEANKPSQRRAANQQRRNSTRLSIEGDARSIAPKHQTCHTNSRPGSCLSISCRRPGRPRQPRPNPRRHRPSGRSRCGSAPPVVRKTCGTAVPCEARARQRKKTLRRLRHRKAAVTNGTHPCFSSAQGANVRQHVTRCKIHLPDFQNSMSPQRVRRLAPNNTLSSRS